MANGAAKCAISFPLEVKLVRHYSRNPDLFPMSRHALHYDLLLTQNKDRSLYMMPLKFTKEKFQVKVVADTGSSILWINGLSCMSKAGQQTCGTYVSYFKYGYLDGPIEGDMIKTEVYLTDDAVSPDTYVLLVQKVKEDMDEPLVGLGPRSSEYPTFMEKLLENGVIKENEFTVDLVTNKITFGRLDLDGYQRTNIPLTNSLGYYTAINEVTLYGRPLFTVAHDCIFDSGNTLIAIPRLFEEAVMAAYKDAGWKCHTKQESNPSFYNVICEVAPVQRFDGTMRFRWGKDEFVLSGEELFVECTRGDSEGRMCKSAIELHDFNNGLILGQPFFNVHPITFNLGENRLEIWRKRSANGAVAGASTEEALAI